MEEQSHYGSQCDPKQGSISVTDQVVNDLKKRREIGITKYGTELQAHNGRNALIDAYQEALDLCLYLKQRLIEDTEKGE